MNMAPTIVTANHNPAAAALMTATAMMPPAVVVAAPPVAAQAIAAPAAVRAPWWSRTAAAMTMAAGTALAAAPAVAQEVDAIPPEEAVGSLTHDIMDKLSSIHMEQPVYLALIVGGALVFDRILSRRISTLEKMTESRARSVFLAGALRWTRGIMWGGATFLGLYAIGVDITSLLYALGIPSAVVAYGLRDFTNNIGAYWAIIRRGDVDIGDHITVGGISGTVVRMSPGAIVVRGFDESGDLREYYIPPSMILDSITEKALFDEKAIASIHKFDYVTIGGKVSGRVVNITKETFGIEQVDSRGITHVVHVQKHTISKFSLINHGKTPPPLPGGLKAGDRIRIDGTDVVIDSYDCQFAYGTNLGSDAAVRIPRPHLMTNRWEVINALV